MLKNQKRKTKACPTCDGGRIYTGAMAAHNARLKDGTQVCESCYIDDFYRRYLKD